jgi:hypothetical protein
MDIGRIVREVEVVPAAEPDRTPLTEPEPKREPEREPVQQRV